MSNPRLRVAVVYPVRDDFEPNAGILNKMRYQVDAFAALGCDAHGYCARADGVVVDGVLTSKYRVLGGRPIRVMNHYGFFWTRLLAVFGKELPDVLYLRQPGTHPALLSFLYALRGRKRSMKIVLEVATYPFEGEADTLSQKLIVASDKVFQHGLSLAVDRIVTFCGQQVIYGIPCIQSSNGIDVDALPIRTPSVEPRVFRMLGVAALAKWHGYDRLIEGISAFKAKGSSTIDSVRYRRRRSCEQRTKSTRGDARADRRGRFSWYRSRARARCIV
ncbi:MAG: hypothetical protein R3A47_07220 [Polyangiales bacterium]